MEALGVFIVMEPDLAQGTFINNESVVAMLEMYFDMATGVIEFKSRVRVCGSIRSL